MASEGSICACACVCVCADDFFRKGNKFGFGNLGSRKRDRDFERVNDKGEPIEETVGEVREEEGVVAGAEDSSDEVLGATFNSTNKSASSDSSSKCSEIPELVEDIFELV